MKAKILLAAVVAAFTFTSFAAQPLLSPRAAGNQPKAVANTDAPTITIAYVVTTAALLSPRAAGNQHKTVQGVTAETTTAQFCRENMSGTPKAITECSSHANMPLCKNVVAQQDQ